MSVKITVKQSIYIAVKPEMLWDFTQDYNQRSRWDDSILEAKMIQQGSARKIAIRAKGMLQFQLIYKLENRPHKSSLAMTEVKSIFIEGGGGSWKYEEKDNGTLWTQTNTLILRTPWSWLKNLIRKRLVKNTAESMLKVKQLLEQ